MSPLLALALALAASPYFFVEEHGLVRAMVEPVAAASSGATPARVVTQAVVPLPGLVMGHAQRGGEDVAVVCPRTLRRTDAAQGCDVFFVDARGGVRPLGVQGFSAELLPGNAAVLVWTDGLELKELTLATGATRTLATSVLEPRLSADGRQVAFARTPGLTRLVHGFVACPFLQSPGGEARRLAGPCDAQAPFVSRDGATLYVTTQGGLAGLVANGQRATGRSRGDFVPVPGRELVWLDGQRALYTAHYETTTLWVFDAATGEAAQLASGREPAWIDGHLFAVDGAKVLQLEVP